MKRLGIIDWGIGGIGIFKLVKERLGGVGITYYSDSGVTPYGKTPRRELAARLDRVIEFLKDHGVTHVVIGCNAASTVLSDLVDHGVPVLGVIEPAVTVSARAKPERLGLIGGRRTVVSGVYRKAFAERGIAVRQRIAQPLSALIESGDTSSDRLREAAAKILFPIRNSTHILLACTHYPAALPVLRSLVSPSTAFIDPATEVVKIAARWKLSDGSDTFYTSGDTSAMRLAARNAFAVAISHAKHISL